ncbi:MAG TPA: transporter [Sphingopyxis sp.]|nr:transporter [Sphingopyxis sp.]
MKIRNIMTACMMMPLIMLFLPAAAYAEEGRDFCPDRPGLGTPACTLDRGQFAVEMGVVDWTKDRQADTRTDTIATADMLLRYGVSSSLEVQLGWTAMGFVRTRTVGLKTHSSGSGDVSLALRQNLQNPDGSGLSMALMPFITLPIGGDTIGAGDWSGGLLLPISYELPADFQLGLTGRIEAAVDADGKGRHSSYGAIIGLEIPMHPAIGITTELSVQRDDDPSGAITEMLAGLSLAWSPNDRMQIDIGTNWGLNRHSPDAQIYLGVARRF